MFDQDFVEMLRGLHPGCVCLYFVPLVAILTMAQYPVPAAAAIEFPVHRLQQFDLAGTAYGCRSSVFNFEARSLSAALTGSGTMVRRCVVAKLKDLDASIVRKLIAENVGSLLIILPQDLGLREDEKEGEGGARERLKEIEAIVLGEETSVPMFFALESPELDSVHREISTSPGSGAEKAATALQALMGSTTANGFQLVAGSSAPKSIPDFSLSNLQGRLPGYGIEDQNPTVVIVAHYDAIGGAATLSTGADSNASGVVALLEIARLFARLYANKLTHAKVNFVFLLAAAGKFNYLGSKRWIDYQLDDTVDSDLSSVKFVLCLDAIGGSEDVENLYLHVSKPPKEGSHGHSFYARLSEAASVNGVGLKMVHKKINLADDFLAWEHERFSMRRLPGFTLSALPHHKTSGRRSLTDVRSSVDPSILRRNIAVVAQALAADVYDIPTPAGAESDEEIGKPSPGFVTESFPGLDVHLLESTLKFLTSVPRSQQLLDKDSQLLQTLNLTLSKYLGSKETKRQLFKADPREPEWVFYDTTTLPMQAFNVKPAIFDLILAAGILAYLGIVYLFVSNFHFLKSAVQPCVYHAHHAGVNGVNGKSGSPLKNGHAKKMA